MPSTMPLLWVSIELDGRRVVLHARDDRGNRVTLTLSRPAATNLSMSLRSVVKVQPSEPFEFATHAELDTA